MSDVEPAFLLSLPRSGSTLLQRLLAAHSQIATVAEPWLLIPPLYTLRKSGVYAEYGHRVAVRAIAGLQKRLPRGRRDYLDAVAEMAYKVYSSLSPPGTRVFIDKTPRYGLVVEELLDTFPDAKFLVLHRNPLAVLASISSTFDRGSWKPYRHKQDLFLLLERLLGAQQKRPDAFIPIRYEDLLANPTSTLERLISTLGLSWEPQILRHFTNVSVEGGVGDSTGVKAYGHISSEPLSKWQRELTTPVRQTWARRYLHWVGAERLAVMGYDMQELLQDLERVPWSYSKLPADLLNAAKGTVWSLIEVESMRDKLDRIGEWRYVFTHT